MVRLDPVTVVYSLTIFRKTPPHTQSQKNLLEMVQRKAARFVFNSYTRNTSVTVLLNRLDWLALEDRRNYATVTMFNKVLHNAVSIDFLPYLHHRPQLHVATIKELSLFLPGSTTTTTHFCHQPSESGTLSVLKLLLLKMLMTFRLNYTHAHSHNHDLSSLCIK